MKIFQLSQHQLNLIVKLSMIKQRKLLQKYLEIESSIWENFLVIIQGVQQQGKSGIIRKFMRSGNVREFLKKFTKSASS